MKLIFKSQSQLNTGIKVEREHDDLYNYFEKYLKTKGIKMPIDKNEFAKKIALVHLKELNDYYDKLAIMEGEHE